MTEHKKNRMKINNRTYVQCTRALLLFTPYSTQNYYYPIIRLKNMCFYCILKLIHKCVDTRQCAIYVCIPIHVKNTKQFLFIFTSDSDCDCLCRTHEIYEEYLRCVQYHSLINHNVLQQILTNLFSLVMSIQQSTSQRNEL